MVVDLAGADGYAVAMGRMNLNQDNEAAVDVDALDTGYLAQFAGLAWNERVLDALHSKGHPKAKTSHGFVFQHLLTGPMTTSALALRMGISQQAASKQVAALMRLGYISRTASTADQRLKLLKLTKKADDAIAVSRGLRRELESKLRKKHGGAAVDAARDMLKAMLGDDVEAAVKHRRVRG
jgi:DNA-binding MarR family transcriptional regulator